MQQTSVLFISPRITNHNLPQGAFKSVQHTTFSVHRPTIWLRKNLPHKTPLTGEKGKRRDPSPAVSFVKMCVSYINIRDGLGMRNGPRLFESDRPTGEHFAFRKRLARRNIALNNGTGILAPKSTSVHCISAIHKLHEKLV